VACSITPERVPLCGGKPKLRRITLKFLIPRKIPDSIGRIRARMKLMPPALAVPCLVRPHRAHVRLRRLLMLSRMQRLLKRMRLLLLVKVLWRLRLLRLLLLLVLLLRRRRLLLRLLLLLRRLLRMLPLLLLGWCLYQTQRK